MEKKYRVKHSGKKDVYPDGGTADSQEGRGRYDLISPIAIRRLAAVCEQGAKHQGDRTWEKGIPFSRLLNSAKRHITQFEEGHDDEDHLAMAMWRLHAMIHFSETRPDLNDLPNHGKTKVIMGATTSRNTNSYTFAWTGPICTSKSGEVCTAKISKTETPKKKRRK
jgi:hypothetical protein